MLLKLDVFIDISLSSYINYSICVFRFEFHHKLFNHDQSEAPPKRHNVIASGVCEIADDNFIAVYSIYMILGFHLGHRQNFYTQLINDYLLIKGRGLISWSAFFLERS